jgi:ferredoxin-fold anticodon binding domain-containing protein
MNISRQNRRAVAQRMLARKKRVIINKRMETRKKMFEAAKKFIGKKCVIYTFNSVYITGVVKEVTDGAVIVDRKGKEEIVNLDFIVRIKDASDNK